MTARCWVAAAVASFAFGVFSVCLLSTMGVIA